MSELECKKTIPFLPGISPKLGRREKRSQLEAVRLLRQKLRAESIADMGTLFGSILPPEVLVETQQDVRKRLFPETVTFWAWASQLLQGNDSCGAAVTFVQGWYGRAGLPLPSFDTSSYCRARQRLSTRFLEKINILVRRYVGARIESHHLWRGHRLKAIDGTSVRLLDTEANQEVFPQPSGQQLGCGFPAMAVNGILDLATGTIDAFISSRDRQHDAQGLYQLRDELGKGDLLLADRAYCSFEAISEFRIDFVGLQNRPRLLSRKARDLEHRIAERVLLLRPNRHEPRATKRRPKSHQFLTAPRSEFVELQHRGHYRKAA